MLQVVSEPELAPQTNVLEMWSCYMKERGFQCVKMFLKIDTHKTPSVRSWDVVRLTKEFPTLDPTHYKVLPFHKYIVHKMTKRWKNVISRLKQRPALLLASSALVCVMILSQNFLNICNYSHSFIFFLVWPWCSEIKQRKKWQDIHCTIVWQRNSNG